MVPHALPGKHLGGLVLNLRSSLPLVHHRRIGFSPAREVVQVRSQGSLASIPAIRSVWFLSIAHGCLDSAIHAFAKRSSLSATLASASSIRRILSICLIERRIS